MLGQGMAGPKPGELEGPVETRGYKHGGQGGVHYRKGDRGQMKDL